MRGWLVRLNALVFRRRIDAELDEEIRYHLVRETERNIASGMAPAEARRAARRAFGNPTVATEQARDAARWPALEHTRQDVLYALRTFRRAPTFVLTVVATIGLGLGLLATAFTLFDAYVLRPPAVRDPHSLYDTSWHSRDGAWHPFKWSQFVQMSQSRDAFADVYAYMSLVARLGGQPAIGQLVSGNYFDMLGVRAAVGRTLRPGDADVPGNGRAIVLSHDAWEAAFGGDSAVIGTTIVVNAVRLTVVGIAPKGFGGLESVPLEFWIPITMAGALDSTRDVFSAALNVGVRAVGRLRPGESPELAASTLSTLLAPSTADRPPRKQMHDVLLVPRATPIPMSAQTVTVMAPLATAFVLVMLIACMNVANVMLARGMARQREIGIRLSLGAARGRLIRQLLTESVVLSVPAALMGYLVSRVTIDLGLVTMIASVPPEYRAFVRPMALTPDTRIVAFTMLAAVLAAVAFGLAPAIQATRPSVVHATRGDFDSNLRPSRLRAALIVGQITMSVVLLITTGVLVHAAHATERLSPGVRTRNLVVVDMLDRGRARAVDMLRGMRSVRGLASASSAPLDGSYPTFDIGAKPSEPIPARVNVVSSGYFSALDLGPVRGRAFSKDEAESNAPVAVVSRSAAQRYWPATDPIGQHLYMSNAPRDRDLFTRFPDVVVIGVVPDAAPGWIGLSPTIRRQSGPSSSPPVVYYPQRLDAAGTTLIARVSTDERTGRAAIDSTLSSTDSIAFTDVHTVQASLGLQRYPFIAAYWVASVVGGIALLLTLIGVYGVLSYVVSQRTREFGVRIALGASPRALVGLVLGHLMRLSLVGAGAGVAIAAAAAAFAGSVLDAVDARDPVGFAIGLGVVLGSCVFAAIVPSRRAAAVNPVDALRAD
ncbi:MAG: FtsX-like permease family protein [Gemmatimonadaceae bacterium]